jgi:hypothetical protein
MNRRDHHLELLASWVVCSQMLLFLFWTTESFEMPCVLGDVTLHCWVESMHMRNRLAADPTRTRETDLKGQQTFRWYS